MGIRGRLPLYLRKRAKSRRGLIIGLFAPWPPGRPIPSWLPEISRDARRREAAFPPRGPAPAARRLRAPAARGPGPPEDRTLGAAPRRQGRRPAEGDGAA